VPMSLLLIGVLAVLMSGALLGLRGVAPRR
jgi:hypothetical protein